MLNLCFSVIEAAESPTEPTDTNFKLPNESEL